MALRLHTVNEHVAAEPADINADSGGALMLIILLIVLLILILFALLILVLLVRLLLGLLFSVILRLRLNRGRLLLRGKTLL